MRELPNLEEHIYKCVGEFEVYDPGYLYDKYSKEEIDKANRIYRSR